MRREIDLVVRFGTRQNRRKRRFDGDGDRN